MKKQTQKRLIVRGVEATDEFLAGIDAVVNLLFKQYLKDWEEQTNEKKSSEDKDAE